MSAQVPQVKEGCSCPPVCSKSSLPTALVGIGLIVTGVALRIILANYMPGNTSYIPLGVLGGTGFLILSASFCMLFDNEEKADKLDKPKALQVIPIALAILFIAGAVFLHVYGYYSGTYVENRWYLASYYLGGALAAFVGAGTHGCAKSEPVEGGTTIQPKQLNLYSATAIPGNHSVSLPTKYAKLIHPNVEQLTHVQIGHRVYQLEIDDSAVGIHLTDSQKRHYHTDSASSVKTAVNIRYFDPAEVEVPQRIKGQVLKDLTAIEPDEALKARVKEVLQDSIVRVGEKIEFSHEKVVYYYRIDELPLPEGQERGRILEKTAFVWEFEQGEIKTHTVRLRMDVRTVEDNCVYMSEKTVKKICPLVSHLTHVKIGGSVYRVLLDADAKGIEMDFKQIELWRREIHNTGAYECRAEFFNASEVPVAPVLDGEVEVVHDRHLTMAVQNVTEALQTRLTEVLQKGVYHSGSQIVFSHQGRDYLFIVRGSGIVEEPPFFQVDATTRISCSRVDSKSEEEIAPASVEEIFRSAGIFALPERALDLFQQIYNLLCGSPQEQMQMRKYRRKGELTTPGHILLKGPPGIGKTATAKAFAKAIGCSGNQILKITTSDVYSSMHGGTTENIKRIFSPPEKGCKVIIWDEIDGVFGDRNEGGRTNQIATNEILSFMDGLKESGRCLVIGTTNHSRKMDRAFMRRMPNQIQLSLPGPEGLREIFEAYYSGYESEIFAEDIDRAKLLVEMAGFSGCDIKILFEQVSRAAALTNATICQQDFLEAIKRIRKQSQMEHGSVNEMTRLTFSRGESEPPLSVKDALGKAGLVALPEEVYQVFEGVFTAVAGTHEEIERLQNYSVDQLLPKLDHILLRGKPGTGKTAAVLAFAEALDSRDIDVHLVSASDLHSKWHGETEKNIADLFSSSGTLKVIIIDEMDGLLGKRSDAFTTHQNKVITEFLAYIGGAKDKGNCLVIGMTNHSEKMDEAFMRRFPLQIEMPLPNREGLSAIAQSYFKRYSARIFEEGVDLSTLLDLMDGFSGSDVQNLFSMVSRKAYQRRDQVTQHDFRDQIAIIQSSKQRGRRK